MFKSIFIALAFVSSLAFAEPSFQQVEGLIQAQQYSAAEQGLVEIIKNHPQSAKAYYAMAQAQAGLGHQDKAQYALDKARGLDPDLKFASSSNIESLQQAITPQVKKIEVVEESHTLRNTILVLFIILLGYIAYSVYRRNKEADDGYKSNTGDSTPPSGPTPSPLYSTNQSYARAMSTPITPPSTTTTAPAPTVVNNHYGSSNDGLLTGVMIGSMMSNHHDTVIVEQAPVYVTSAPAYVAPQRDSSWDTPSAPSKSSSWDDDSSSKKSSSWDDSSSSSSSSSWDSSSSSDSSWSSSDSSSSSDW